MTPSLAPYERLSQFARPSAAALTHVGRFPLVKLALVVAWLYVLWRGEYGSFGSKINSCQWDMWEDWPAGATPHHLILLADPQLVDPHTYPGRPWLLEKATIAHTDQYLRRTYDTLQNSLDPDSVIFLGDLFDGGREWSTSVADNPDTTWKGYGESFWLREYNRWGKIFTRNNGVVGRRGHHPRGDRKIIASLPGNHDLGISSGVRIDVRNRFSAFFGEGNRVDVIGNHSFVSVDTVSLTAKAIENAQERKDNEKVWEPASRFLDGVKKQKAQALERYLSGKTHKPENPRMEHSVLKISDAEAKAVKTAAGEGLKAEVPTILLTHVPLYRAAGTPCGPLREKYPPSPGMDKIEGPVTDERNALSLHAGYQYQNVLHPDISKELIERVGNVAHVFSGDDHDHCEVVHRGYTSLGGGVREITVKSMSWAMGVRKPGFLLASLWNPIDETGAPTGQHSVAGSPTIQTKLCLLPDALGNFIGYGQMFLITVLVLLVAANLSSLRPGNNLYAPLLPVNELDKDSWRTSRRDFDFSSGLASSNSSMASRGTTQRTRANTGSNGYAMPSSHSDDKYTSTGRSSPLASSRSPLSKLRATLREFAISLLQVSVAGFTFYCWLAYTF